MNHSGDAAEQIVRMSLEGVEVAAKITGNAAKEIAFLIMTALKSPDKKGGNLKLSGKERMATMLKSGKALEIFSVKESDLQKFYQGAKQYGIVYCVLRNTKQNKDGLCDIMVKADDAPKINRLVERFKFATVDKARIESEIVAAKSEKAAGKEPDAPDINDTDKLLDDLLGTNEGKAEPEQPEKATAEQESAANPTMATTEKSPLSEPISESESNSIKGTFDVNRDVRRPSVKDELREIKAAQKKKEADAPVRDDKAASDKSKTAPTSTAHKQPQGGRKPKSRKTKERA